MPCLPGEPPPVITNVEMGENGECLVWTGQVRFTHPIEDNMTVQIMNMNVGGNVELFSTRGPKPDAIRAVKLTDDNLKEVGAYFLKALGGIVEVNADEAPRGVVRVVDHYASFYVGEYIVEEWDYKADRVKFRVANLTERERYDLR